MEFREPDVEGIYFIIADGRDFDFECTGTVIHVIVIRHRFENFW